MPRQAISAGEKSGQPGESIYDPTCGTGGMLISCLAEAKRRGGDTRTIGLYGQELITITAAIARMNLVIHGVSDFHIASGNTLADLRKVLLCTKRCDPQGSQKVIW
ncbi:HsdM family class I SAM-dependent methyltransferase [Primorskyibacter sp. 2E233]|uniref:HsdM family class I SAM-dependent methyltransferase n=1 Tax=Primorskyibacter sp. 2E233 TaxID=3413431 RepID=UPI003BF3CF33